MKKAAYLFVLFIAVLTTMNAQDSVSFRQKSVVVSLNYDLGIYATENHDKKQDTTINDGAGNHNFTLSAEFGLLKWLGVGARVGGATYITSADSATGARGTASSLDFGILVNAHVIRTKKFDLPIGIALGKSDFKYQTNTVDNGEARDFGSYFKVYVNPRIYFGEKARFGINFNLAYATMSYKSIDLQNNSTKEEDRISLKGKGINIGMGFQMRF
jgi:hypothetical protein